MKYNKEQKDFFKELLLYTDKLIPDNSTIIVGLSGGPDSVFLLHLLNSLKEKKKLKLIAAHLDHEWRDDSYKDEEFCKELVQKCNENEMKDKKERIILYQNSVIATTDVGHTFTVIVDGIEILFRFIFKDIDEDYSYQDGEWEGNRLDLITYNIQYVEDNASLGYGRIFSRTHDYVVRGEIIPCVVNGVKKYLIKIKLMINDGSPIFVLNVHMKKRIRND